MKRTTLQYGIMFLVLIAGFLFITEQRAEASTKWVKKVVSVPYTYYDYETQIRYRTVRKAFTVIEYRYERRAVTTYRYERQRVAIERPGRRRGVTKIRYVWKDVEVPVTTYERVRVPYERTVYRTVREAYKVRVRVKRTGYRNEVQWVKVHVPDRKYQRHYERGNRWNNDSNSSFEYSRGGFTVSIGTGRDYSSERYDRYNTVKRYKGHKNRKDRKDRKDRKNRKDRRSGRRSRR
ncbi:MAG: hypothetical protein KAR11_05490 [Phycisphaerae bacterium]|nr:hypothetical protein [Phycisphaerae bacterium]